MSNSSLVCYTKISPNKTSKRNHAIDTIAIHCMAGNLTVERCGDVFAATSRKASSNYGVGTDGRIGLYVEEKDRSWCTSSATVDNRAVTIEVANDGGSPDWHVSDKALASLIKLCADICKRNGIKRLVWSNNKSDRVNHVNGCNMEVHRDHASKSCPGNYLYGKHPYIAEQVNKLLGSSSTVVSSTSTTAKSSTTSSSKKDYSPVFDASYYSNRYSDVKKAFGTDSNKLLDHFLTYGVKEKRQASSKFSIAVYISSNEDLRKAFGTDYIKYIDHYLTYGIKEKRKCV